MMVDRCVLAVFAHEARKPSVGPVCPAAPGPEVRNRNSPDPGAADPHLLNAETLQSCCNLTQRARAFLPKDSSIVHGLQHEALNPGRQA